MTRTMWTDDMIESEIRPICQAIGWFPSSRELRTMGRNDLACIISRRGGYIAWADRVGFPRRHSDSDTGWEGEEAFAAWMVARGHITTKPDGVTAPYDRLVDGVLRVDVKAARFANYGPCSGWFYRIGKHPQADMIVLWQLDTGNFYGLPYWVCPTTNVTISQGGGRYAQYHNNIDMIRQMVEVRKNERLKAS